MSEFEVDEEVRREIEIWKKELEEKLNAYPSGENFVVKIKWGNDGIYDVSVSNNIILGVDETQIIRISDSYNGDDYFVIQNDSDQGQAILYKGYRDEVESELKARATGDDYFDFVLYELFKTIVDHIDKTEYGKEEETED